MKYKIMKRTTKFLTVNLDVKPAMADMYNLDGNSVNGQVRPIEKRESAGTGRAVCLYLPID